MRKLYICMLVFLCCLFVSACGEEEHECENEIQIYYINNSETKVEAHVRDVLGSTTNERVDEILKLLETNPDKLEYKAPLSLGFKVLSSNYADEKVILDVDAAYLRMSVTTEVLVRAAIVRTLTQLEDVKYVGITVEGNQLFDKQGDLIGLMSAEQFIDNDGSEINTYELVKVKLFFANEDGSGLIAAYREKHYSTNTPIERFIVEELIAGPSGQVPGLFPTINPATKIINISTKDGICYINLDDNFLVVSGNVSTDLSIYSITNSLVELSNINKVQILINGEVPATISNTFYERNLDVVTTLK